jgi:hypothetical protein
MSNTTINTITVTMLFIIVVGCILGLSFQQHLLCEAKIALVQEQLLAMQKQNADLQTRSTRQGLLVKPISPLRNSVY